MITYKKEFYLGLSMILAFAVVFAIIFSPVFNGQNGLQYLDSLYNSISKGSAYYIPKAQKESAKVLGTSLEVTVSMADQQQAEQTAALFKAAGAEATVNGPKVAVKGDFGKVLEKAVADADLMYHNDGAKIAAAYGYPERQVLFNWWTAFSKMQKNFVKEGNFAMAKPLHGVMEKALEPSYNYYKIDAQNISERKGVVFLSLLFYIIYTVWYGYGILFLFEGLGLKFGH